MSSHSSAHPDEAPFQMLASAGATVLEVDGVPVVEDGEAILGPEAQGDEYAIGLVPHLDDRSEGRLVLSSRWAPFEVMARNGDALAAFAKRNLAREPKQREALARLLRFFPGMVLRLPEVHECLADVRKEEGESAVRRLMGTLFGARGRRPDHACHMHTLCLVQQIVLQEGLSVRKAAELVRGRVPDASAWTTDSLCNRHSEYRTMVLAYSEGYFVPASALLPVRWGDEPRRLTRYVAALQANADLPNNPMKGNP